MRFRMLGPLRVHNGDGWDQVTAPQQRVVLAVLLIEAGRVVSTEKLVDAVWGDSPPRTATNTVAAYVLRLRQLVGADVLATRGRGYELTLREGDIDAQVFERLLEAARRDLERGGVDSAADKLSQALALWQGPEPALADVPPRSWFSARVIYLEQLRLAATEEHAAVMLELGRHAEVVEDLYRLVREQPLREQRWALLMTALERDGRRSEALAAYKRARQILLAELALEPGQQLQRLQQAILNGTMLPSPVSTRQPIATPAQLPGDVVGFTGRADQLAQLDSMVPDHAGPVGTALAISALAGAAGVGKTALAIHWAHRVAPSFPDGQLYVDLRGYAPVPAMPPIEALSRFLRALGVPAEQVPSDVDEAAAMYRSLLTGKRVLVLLDNAYDPDQIRPLLPAPGCLTLITSRDRLAGLIARDGATAIVLDVLSDDEAADLLLRLLGRDRVRAEPGAVKELARLCGYLPLALRIASANLITNSYPSIETCVASLAGDRLDNLEVDGDPRTGIRAAFDLSYAALAPAARRLFRRMGFLPGQDLAAGGAAAMLSVEPVAAGRLLSRLTTAHLAQESRSGRFALYTLVRDYAGEKAAAEESKNERQAALGRLYDYYLRHVDGAGRQLYPEMLRLPPAVPVLARFKDKADAMEWLDAERSNLVATVVHCATHGPQPVAWQLADGLRGYFQRRMLAAEWHEVAKAGIAAAEAAGDAFALTASHLNLAALHATTGNKEEAINGYNRTVELAEEAFWPEAKAAAVSNIGAAYLSLGRFEQAAVHLSRSLAMRRRIGWPIGEATDLDNLGLAYWGRGRLELAAEHHARAAEIYHRLDAPLAEAKAHGALAVAYHGLGQLAAARDLLTESLKTLREAGDRYSFGHAGYCLADVYRDLGNFEAAMGLAEAALTAATEIGHPSLESSALATLASLHHQLGENRKAIDGHRLALERARAAGDLYRQADSMVRLAASCHSTEPAGAAKDVAQQALDLSCAEGYRLLEGQALTVLAAAQLACGEAETAAETAIQALDRHASTGHRLGRARAHLVAGHAWQRLGEGGRAKAHLAEAQAAFDELAIDSATHIRMLTSR